MPFHFISTTMEIKKLLNICFFCKFHSRQKILYVSVNKCHRRNTINFYDSRICPCTYLPLVSSRSKYIKAIKFNLLKWDDFWHCRTTQGLPIKFYRFHQFSSTLNEISLTFMLLLHKDYFVKFWIGKIYCFKHQVIKLEWSNQKRFHKFTFQLS